MLNYEKKNDLVTILIFPTRILFTISGYAQEGDVEFSVKALIPDNQIDTKKSYFDLRMKPKQKQEIETILYNSSDEEMNIKISVYNATTNQNGLIVYEDQNAKIVS